MTKLTVGDSLWYRASSEGQEGWVSASVLNVENDTADRVPDEIQTPALFATIPPQGAWCESGQTVWICAYNFKYPEKVGYQNIAQGARAIALVIQVNNTSDADVHVNPNDFTIVMDDGRTYAYAPETFTYWDSALEGITISPGDKTIGGLLFVVPAKGGIERVISRNAQGDTVTIDLRNSPYEP